MPDAALVPRFMIERKPKHGAPCNNCGACCYAILCDLAQNIHHRRQGPCPELVMDDNGSRCGLIERSEGEKREAALLLINAGKGCDMLLHSEPRNHRHTAKCDTFDRKNRDRLSAARKLWSME